MKIVVAFILSILWIYNLQAQIKTCTIYGNIKDSIAGEQLINASLKLVSEKDSVMIRQTVSGKAGFKFERILSGNYSLSLSHIGYKDTIFRISIGAKDSVYNAGTLVMTKSGDELVEVIVKTTIPPVITKNDTIIYNASAFKTRPNATVEELLKKLPGVEVDKDGNITFQGEPVQKIYIDGKDFFVNDPKLASQNLLAGMVQKVEAFDLKSEKAKLSGVPDDKPSKAINLRLKADKKKGYFGNMAGGYDSYNRPNINASITYMNGHAMAMANGGLVSSGTNRVNNDTKSIGVNYTNVLSENVQFNISYNAGDNKSRNWSAYQRESFMTDSSLLQQSEGSSVAGNSNHTISLGVNYKIDSFSVLDVASSVGTTSSKIDVSDVTNSSIGRAGVIHQVNSAIANNTTSDNGWNGSISVNYKRGFRKQGRYIGLSAQVGMNQNNGDAKQNSLTKFYDDNGMMADSLERNQVADQDNKGLNVGFRITYTEPVGKKQVLDMYYNMNNTASENSRNAFNYNPVTGKYDERDTMTSNAFENTNSQHNFGIGYNHFRSYKLRYQLGIGMSKNLQDNISNMGVLPDIAQRTMNIFPRASLMYTICKQQTIRLNYTGSTRPPGITELQPVPDFSNPLLIQSGNPSLKTEFNNVISAEYKKFNEKKLSSVNLGMSYRNTMNRIVNSVITNAQGIQEQQFVNMNGDYGVTGSIGYDISLLKKQQPLSVRSNTALRLNRDANLVNRVLNKRHGGSVNQQFTVNYTLGDKLFASVIAALSYRATKYSIQTTRRNTFFSQRYTGNISYEFPGAIVLTSDVNMSFNDNAQQSNGQNAIVWNAGVTKKMFKEKQGELSLFVLDIFNDSNGFNRNIGDNYIVSRSTEVVKRIFRLSFVYRFRGNAL